MTGYAEAVSEQGGVVLTVSVRSVNHRFLDLHVYMPEKLQSLEPRIRREVQERNPRGRVDLKISVEGMAQETPQVDEALLSRYIELFRRLGGQHGLSAEIDLAALCRLPGVINVSALNGELSSREDLASRLEAPLLAVLGDALRRWDEMRAAEARFLVEDMAQRIENIRQAAGTLEARHAEVVALAQKRMQERLDALLGQAGIEPARLAQEAALLAERADSNEEILRLKTHASRFAATLEEESDVGRKLDFLLQEMHREVNTFLAKTAGLGECSLDLTDTALEIKGEIEKLREQVQNLQ